MTGFFVALMSLVFGVGAIAAAFESGVSKTRDDPGDYHSLSLVAVVLGFIALMLAWKCGEFCT